MGGALAEGLGASVCGTMHRGTQHPAPVTVPKLSRVRLWQILMEKALKPPKGCPGCGDLPGQASGPTRLGGHMAGSMSPSQPLEQEHPSLGAQVSRWLPPATSATLVPPAMPREHLHPGTWQHRHRGGLHPLDFKAPGDLQGWRQGLALPSSSRGCPGSPLPEQGRRNDLSRGCRQRCGGS